jgi:hypothetical protein
MPRCVNVIIYPYLRTEYLINSRIINIGGPQGRHPNVAAEFAGIFKIIISPAKENPLTVCAECRGNYPRS